MYKEMTLPEIQSELKLIKNKANNTVNFYFKKSKNVKKHKDDIYIDMDLSDLRSIEYFSKTENGKLHLYMIKVIDND